MQCGSVPRYVIVSSFSSFCSLKPIFSSTFLLQNNKAFGFDKRRESTLITDQKCGLIMKILVKITSVV